MDSVHRVMPPRMCPDCDAALMETTTGVEMTSQQRRYYCVDRGAHWRALDGETLVEDEETQ